ncbi:MAG: nucleotidyltransferase domain-containing protein [Cyanobacteria bacterium P01_F01_bin.150]
MTTTVNDINVSVPIQRVIPQEELQQRLREFKVERGTDFSLTQIGYFGSYSRQEARPDSDVDIIFQTTQPLSHNCCNKTGVRAMA